MDVNTLRKQFGNGTFLFLRAPFNRGTQYSSLYDRSFVFRSPLVTRICVIVDMYLPCAVMAMFPILCATRTNRINAAAAICSTTAVPKITHRHNAVGQARIAMKWYTAGNVLTARITSTRIGSVYQMINVVCDVRCLITLPIYHGSQTETTHGGTD